MLLNYVCMPFDSSIIKKGARRKASGLTSDVHAAAFTLDQPQPQQKRKAMCKAFAFSLHNKKTLPSRNTSWISSLIGDGG